MRTRWATVVLLCVCAILAAGCNGATATARPVAVVTPAPTPVPPSVWPGHFESGVCLAQRDLASMSDHLKQISDAAAAYDTATIASEAAKMNSAGKSATDHLALIDAWPPGAPMVAHLSAAATAFRKAANLYLAAIKDEDAAGITAGTKQMTAAVALYSKAGDGAIALNAATGFTCPY